MPAALNLRVLLVEGNAEVSAAIRPVLEAFGCAVTHSRWRGTCVSTRPLFRLVVMTGYAAQLEEIGRQGFTLLPEPWTAADLARALRG